MRRRYCPRPAEPGCTILLAPDGTWAATAGGIEYEVEHDGTIEVPTQFASELLARGFTRAPTPTDPQG